MKLRTAHHRGRCSGRLRVAVLLVAAAALGAAPVRGAATSAKDLYTQALARERTVRDVTSRATLHDFRALVRAYERIPYRYPVSGYSDNALWQAGGLALVAYERFHDEADRRTGERLLKTLRSEYPSSSLVPRVAGRLKDFESVAPAWADAQVANAKSAAEKAAADQAASAKVAPPPVSPPAPRPGTATIRRIIAQTIESGSRVIIELDGEVPYHEERLSDPPRVFFDLKGATVDPAIDPGQPAAPGDLIKAIRLGKHPDDTTRVVVELTAEPRYSVFALFDPYRLVVDFDRPKTQGPSPDPPPDPPVPAVGTARSAPDAVAASTRAMAPAAAAPLDATPMAPATVAAPVAPTKNSDGSFSLARQLGLGISRIVIDPGHGGHDPGAKGTGITEADTVLDIALRLETLLRAQPGFEVVMTRRTDVFVSLEERTAIANRENADLFLSIHANASRSKSANGVETYFLNFASNPEAQSVAARENSASGGAMHNLPDIVKAIALNNKLDESRDLARFVQEAVVKRVKPQYKAVRSLGVKQAPFVVLIGAQMPSVLAEVSFITNRTEATLLRKGTYRQRVAQALFDAILKYQRALKNSIVTAQQ